MRVGVSVNAFKTSLNNNDDFDSHFLQVVMAPGTHLYFDHPHEPDPEERGLYWACRFIDTHKVFSFAPDDLLSNADVKITGEELTKLDLRLLHDSEDYIELKETQNIKGFNRFQVFTDLFPYIIIFQRLHCKIFH